MTEKQLRYLSWHLFRAMKDLHPDCVGEIQQDGTCHFSGEFNLLKVAEEFNRLEEIQRGIDLCNSMLFVDAEPASRGLLS